ncbi:DUF5994 family protein [Mycobacterium sp. 1274761.0]|uniref:DUF5994 family protein n=1 Tax=Mycobacterium sp. 1274761.0 TaxID=1834077 RepID=UPI001E291B75|nr:DUF5994 family protein [Mycobacterium sp. 1274761.0]
MARPVRLTLAARLGGDIDGAWWPHSGSVADELPGLIGTLHKPLGEIVDIRINWSVTEGPLDLETLVAARAQVSTKCRRPRLMFVDGKNGCAKLLVVPHMTSVDLGMLVMRCAAAIPIVGHDRDGRAFQTADLVVRTAQVASANWAAHMRD